MNTVSTTNVNRYSSTLKIDLKVTGAYVKNRTIILQPTAGPSWRANAQIMQTTDFFIWILMKMKIFICLWSTTLLNMSMYRVMRTISNTFIQQHRFPGYRCCGKRLRIIAWEFRSAPNTPIVQDLPQLTQSLVTNLTIRFGR